MGVVFMCMRRILAGLLVVLGPWLFAATAKIDTQIERTLTADEGRSWC